MSDRRSTPLAVALLASVLAHLLVANAQLNPSSSIIVNKGTLRVQALSPTLLRIEPRGPQGFEDRTTFTVVNREFAGVPIWKESESASETVLSTGHYKVHLQGNVGVYWYVSDMKGEKVYDAIDDLSRANVDTGFHKEPNHLHWPSPLKSKSYALVDSPRFFAPKWGITPQPKDAANKLSDTNGFDFGNNVDGDTYIFLLGDTLDTWSASRSEFLKLSGPCPLLPDYAYGTWFTRWHNYTGKEAEGEVQKWDDLKLPLDVWGLDMNWRNTSSVHPNWMANSVGMSDGSDWYYDRPDTALFHNFSEWFAFLHSKKLKTYFNDHPYPVASRGAGGLQTSPEEVKFRWEGLSKWLKDGLDFWWFDRNWRFSIPPPFTNTSRTGASWEGLDNAVWGSYVYYKTTEEFDGQKRRPMALTKTSPIDWRPGLDAVGAAEHPAQHRFPVWWTGDGVPLQGSVESMVDAGVHDFKPFVHSDCGGDYRGKEGGDLLRWTAHCVFGSILRFHGEDHRPWSYDDHTTVFVRKYLEARYKLAPSLIAAGKKATDTGFPLVARGDLYWPKVAGSDTNQQYVFLDDILVAPIWDSDHNVTSRQVWIPPGSWEDVWDGSITKGPRTITVSQPWERQPMWHRHDGGLLVLANEPKLRIEDQDWSSLTLEVFPSLEAGSTHRSIFESAAEERTDIHLATSSLGEASVNISGSSSGKSRSWVIRFHLYAGYEVADTAVVYGEGVPETHVLYPNECPDHDPSNFFPYGGAGTEPAVQSGPVVEVHLPPHQDARLVKINVVKRQEILV